MASPWLSDWGRLAVWLALADQMAAVAAFVAGRLDLARRAAATV